MPTQKIINLCDVTFPTPEANLACDEVLLDLCEQGKSGEVLRFWESSRHFVVVGYANKVASEVHLDFCRGHDIPVLRRCSGGGAVVQGPGSLNYCLVLRLDAEGPLHSITNANRFILERNRDALSRALLQSVELRGHTDLTINGVKFSGNSQRRRSKCLLFHGTFLLNFDLSLIERMLPMPSQQPGYRLSRGHSDFLMNLNVPASAVKAALARAWNAAPPAIPLPVAEIDRLARDRYGSDAWNLKF